MSVTHTFVSLKPPLADPTIVDSTKWNDVHVVDIVNADVNVAAGIVESKLALNFPTHAAVTIGVTPNGLSILGQVISLALASAATTGALSDTDWNTFNSKQAALAFPLAANLGGTGIANAVGSTLTLGAATSITGGGTVALGGFTLTIPATGTVALLGATNLFTGINSFTRGTDSTNTFIGGAGNTTGTATNNVAIGASAFVSFTGGSGQNFALGTNSLTAVTTGDNNLGIGFNTLKSTDTGAGNVAIGASAMSDSTGAVQNNVAIGTQALQKVTASTNVAIGFLAGAVSTSANLNTFIGARAGGANTTGDNNIYIGYRAGARQTTAGNLFIVDSTDRGTVAVELENSFLIGSMAAGGYLQLNIPTTTNNAVQNTLKLQTYVSTAATGAANGFGVGLPFYAETATDATYQQQGLIATSWIDATDATRKAKMSLSAYDTAARLGMEIEASGTAAKLSFYGGTTVVRGAALTTQLTTLTFTAPGTPDYAIQDFVDVSLGAGWAFANHDEANSVLSVIANLQTRVAELEARLGSATGVNLFA